jgi:hypothetical protein
MLDLVGREITDAPQAHRVALWEMVPAHMRLARAP